MMPVKLTRHEAFVKIVENLEVDVRVLEVYQNKVLVRLRGKEVYIHVAKLPITPTVNDVMVLLDRAHGSLESAKARRKARNKAKKEKSGRQDGRETID